MLDQIQIILSHTTHPGNIGAAARAMKVMGLSQLKLINPKFFPSAEATERASKAADILSNAKVYTDINSALSECRLVVGASVRTRSLPSRLVTPRELTTIIKQKPENQPIAILFGTENSGLTNDELHLCHYQVYIPTNPEYSSLNLASAVQLISYEMRLAFAEMQQLPEAKVNANEQSITQQQFDSLQQHFYQIMLETGYVNPHHVKQLENRLNRLLSKAQVTQSENRLLRGFLSAIEKRRRRVSQPQENEEAMLEREKYDV
ncbi:MAG: RNA methyltransferase [Enterobacterales bacterium]|nr:RNA methyltransferase [Enterobacterales bacterium]